MTAFTKLNTTGGTISNNKTIGSGMGGVVCVSAISSVGGYDKTTFITDGGSIIGNEASNGGIYVNSDEVYLNA